MLRNLTAVPAEAAQYRDEILKLEEMLEGRL